jgi:shikimate kinase
MKRALLLLVGPKGAGKTHIGTVLERRLGVDFLRVEPLFLRAQAEERDGQRDVFEELQRREAQGGERPICIETTGASRPMLEAYVTELAATFDVLPVRVTAPEEVCARRVRERSSVDHIAVSDQRVREVNARAREVSMEWLAEIDTHEPLDDDSIVRVLEPILRRARPA